MAAGSRPSINMAAGFIFYPNDCACETFDRDFLGQLKTIGLA